MRTTMLGTPCSLPLYLSATALGKYADPVHGEVSLVKAAHNSDVIYVRLNQMLWLWNLACHAGAAHKPGVESSARALVLLLECFFSL